MSKYYKVTYDDTQVWRTSELVNFVTSIKNKSSIQELSSVYRRSPDCIKTKLKYLAADYYFTDPAVFKQIQELTGITEKEFLVQRFHQRSLLDEEKMTVTPPPEKEEPTEEAKEKESVDICTMIAYNILDSITSIRLLIQNSRNKVMETSMV
jgi:hypothetical protein